MRALILGCTHYPFFFDAIQSELPELRLIDIGVALSETVRRDLDLVHAHADNRVEYCFSDRETSFKRFDTEHLMSLPKGEIRAVNIEQF